MRKVVIAALLSVFVAAPAVAASGKNSVGINYGLDYSGVFGLQGDFDISSSVDNAPISVQPFLKRGSETIFGTTYSITAVGVAGIYDLSSAFKVDRKVQPYAGLGIRRVTSSVANPLGGTLSASKSDLHITLGAKYEFSPQVSGDFNYNDFGGLTFGVVFGF